MNEKILIVDDEKDIRDLISYNLKKEGFKIKTAVDGREALEKIDQSYDLVILDVMMPNLDGFEFCKRIKSSELIYKNIPIIFLTAKDSEINQIIGLELGADDYIIKPVSMSILIARVRALLRRNHQSNIDGSRIIKFSKLMIDIDAQSVKCCNNQITLTKTEFELLLTLARAPEKVFRRHELLDAVIGYDTIVLERVIDVHIKKIRDKLGVCDKYIQTIRGVGYSLRDNEAI
tara:strand:- start:177 stop:872 length:696 start_codon:yes stop_codon:yes gene_type:complete